jgi:hypothetical protein
MRLFPNLGIHCSYSLDLLKLYPPMKQYFLKFGEAGIFLYSHLSKTLQFGYERQWIQ